ncbi:MAG: hypothetical protein CFH44_00441 [Proteobacteria bacterium]|nr:MAG: hypothetical protein CFH44_00441 [Pseudomonadota bacterium]
MMKKLLAVLFILFATVPAFAESYINDIKFMGETPIDVERPLFNVDYTTLHSKSLKDATGDVYFEGGLRYYYGYSKRLDVPYYKDYTAAAKWFYEAGMKNHKLAAYYLGNMYTEGKGVPLDNKTAVWWYNKSRELGFSTATFALANLYTKLYFNENKASFKGIYLKEAKALYESLLSDNNPHAYYNLAVLKLKTEKMTRFVQKDINNLLLASFNEFIVRAKRMECYEILKIMRYLKLDGYQYAEKLFNENFRNNY